MTDTAREDVRQAVWRAVENLKTLAEKNPSAPVQGHDFNALLQRARHSFLDVPAMWDIGLIDGGTTMGELMLKLSILQGAVDAWYIDQSRRETEELNRRAGRRR
jgi:hypothetical protein